MSDDDFKFEPIRGLPELPPAGERILWQGAPDWRRLAMDVFHVHWVAIYFAGLIAVPGVLAGADGQPLPAIAYAMAKASILLVPLGLLAVGILGAVAYLTERTTVYTITSQRVVMRYGIALPITFNLPFKVIGSAGLALKSDGTGDIALSFSSNDRIAYLVMWPHTRPWRISKPEPMLRAVPHAAQVAELLADALTGAPVPAMVPAVANAAPGRDAGALGQTAVLAS